jgi:hypothetical protein
MLDVVHCVEDIERHDILGVVFMQREAYDWLTRST